MCREGIRFRELLDGASSGHGTTRHVWSHLSRDLRPFPSGHEQYQEHGGAQHFPILVFTGVVGNEKETAQES